MAKKVTAKRRQQGKPTSRQPLIVLATGKQGGGKTYTTKQEIKAYVVKYGRPVLIIDRNDEYKGILRVPYDVRHDENRRARPLIKCNGAAKTFRIVCKKDGWDTYDRKEMLTVLYDTAKYFRNGLIVAEEMNNYVRTNVDDRFYSWFTNLRHAGIDFIGHFQRVGDAHPAVWGNTKIWRLHPTQDSVTRPSTKAKVPDYELARIAEIALKRKEAAGERFPKLYADFDKGKIIGCNRDELYTAVRAYFAGEGKAGVKAIAATSNRQLSATGEFDYAIGQKLKEYGG